MSLSISSLDVVRSDDTRVLYLLILMYTIDCLYNVMDAGLAVSVLLRNVGDEFHSI